MTLKTIKDFHYITYLVKQVRKANYSKLLYSPKSWNDYVLDLRKWSISLFMLMVLLIAAAKL